MVSRADRATRETEYVVAQYFKLLVSKPSFGPSPHSLLSVPMSLSESSPHSLLSVPMSLSFESRIFTGPYAFFFFISCQFFFFLNVPLFIKVISKQTSMEGSENKEQT